ADLRRLAGFELERINGDRVFGRRIVVEHDPRLAPEHALPQREPVERETRPVPDDPEARHPVDALWFDAFAAHPVEPGDPLGDDGAILGPFALLGGLIAFLEPDFEGGD